MDQLMKTPLYQRHLALKAKMVEFGGWLMPLQYTGILEEHRNVRSKAGIFDVSHMGEFLVSGKQAVAFLQKLLTNDAGKLVPGQIQYSLLCYETGGVVDDLLVYKMGEQEFWLVVNAGNKEKDLAWIRQKQKEWADLPAEVVDISSQTGLLAVQGPLSLQILEKLTDLKLEEMKYYHFQRGIMAGVDALVSRTGYTGEDGFEIYLDAEKTGEVWDKIITAGQPLGLVPVGLGARDTLRFEAGMPLYGHELSSEISPLEAGLNRFIAWEKGDFCGRQSLEKQKAEGIPRKLVGLTMVERGIARAGYEVKKAGKKIGVVTTGSYAPSLEANLAMAIIDSKEAVAGNKVQVAVRGKDLAAEIIKRPFYNKKEGKK